MKYLAAFLLLLTALVASASNKVKRPGNKTFMYRVTLADKQHSNYSLNHPGRWLSSKSIERRRRQGLELDSTDLPVSPYYVRQLNSQKGLEVVGRSRWNNTVLVKTADTLAARRLRDFSFVEKVRHVWTSPDSTERLVKVPCHTYFQAWDSARQAPYGHAQEQIEALQGQRLHNISMRGKGMTIAVLDGGFQNADVMAALSNIRIVGSHDFINPAAPTLFFETDHGTKVLSAMAANRPEVLVGTAPEAAYWLLRCEDQHSEQLVEEDYWAMAAEFADSAGVDIINSSLGYNEFDDPAQSHRLRDLDGESTLISRTASMLARKGIVLVNSAGNTGMGPWKKLCVPADAHEILTVGALNQQLTNAPFSGVGPTQDGRVKPDVMAPGAPAALFSGKGSVVRDMGTSFAAPIVSGLVACLWQALPGKSALDIISLVRKTSDNYHTPDNIYGYGRPNFWRAFMIGKLEEVKTE